MATRKRASELESLRVLAKRLRDQASRIDQLQSEALPDLQHVHAEVSLRLRNAANELEVWANILGRGAK